MDFAYRFLVALAAGAVFSQGLLAGQFLDGTYAALAWHQANASIIGVLLVLTLVAQLFLLRRHDPRSARTDLTMLIALIALVGVEATLGAARVVVAHVPLGVLISTLTLVLLLRAWGPNTSGGNR